MVSAAITHALRMDAGYAFPGRTTAPQIWRTYFTNLPKLPPNQSTKHFYKEPEPAFNPIPDEKDITIEGYFQSEKYWHDRKASLAAIMGFQYHVSDHVAVHVRRGDYLKYPDRFPVLPLKYYFDAFDRMRSLGYKNYRIYSDDTMWCRTEFKELWSKLNISVDVSLNKDPLTDMKDMYNASAFIIANSTFSLYPALLRIDNPLVIAPAEDRWFGPAAKHLNSPDRMPERFIKI
jgi:hypothetical protein